MTAVSESPSEASVIASLPGLLARQRAAFSAELPVTAAVRKDRLRRAINLLLEHQDELVAALSKDFGARGATMSRLADIMSSVLPLKHALDHLDRWMRPEKRGLEIPLGLLGARARVESQPKGVVGIISPWNFPVSLTFAPLAGIFAAGNRALVKPSEFTPETSAVMARRAAQHFDAAELAFVTGGPDVGRAFAALAFDHLVFTGATSVAPHILRAAAENLVPVTLELGGKCPVIIGRSADPAVAAERVATGKLLNAGQACIAPDYVLVPRAHEPAFVAALQASMARMFPTLLANDDYAAVINDRHRTRLRALLDDAAQHGAEIVTVNPANEDFAGSPKLPPQLLRNVRDDLKVMQEEIFGPILPVQTYDEIDDAIARVNGRARPLALYYFGADAAEQRRVLDRTISGGVTVNDVMFHYSAEDLPFGGIGPSGMGSYHGRDGFRTFSHARAVYFQPSVDVVSLAGFKPPYGAKTQRTLSRALKPPS